MLYLKIIKSFDLNLKTLLYINGYKAEMLQRSEDFAIKNILNKRIYAVFTKLNKNFNFYFNAFFTEL